MVGMSGYPHSWLSPDWPAPKQVRAISTSREGGVSTGPYASMNLGDHVDDDPAAVAENRRCLAEMLALPSEPLWLTQVHGIEVLGAEGECADARVVSRPGQVAVVMTADCLPVLFCDREGREVAAAHAGWRGLVAGILEETVEHMQADNSDILAWLGPAIGPTAFEVGDEVRQAFLDHDPQAQAAIVPSQPGRWLADIYLLARQRLSSAGIMQIYGGGLCTYSDTERYYSFRRDGATGRMASLIWISGEQE
jgi:polyphenol oxidase